MKVDYARSTLWGFRRPHTLTGHYFGKLLLQRYVNFLKYAIQI